MLDAATLRVDADWVSLMFALLSRRMPSTSMAVPKAALPRSPVLERRAKRVSFIRVELTVCPPGSNDMMSLSERTCEWSSVVRSRV